MQTTVIELFLLEFRGVLVTLHTKEVSSYRNRLTFWSSDETSGQRLTGTSPVPSRGAIAHMVKQSPWPHYRPKKKNCLCSFTEHMVKQSTQGGSGHTLDHLPQSLSWELCLLMLSLNHCGFKFHYSKTLGTFVPLIQCSVLMAEAVTGTNPPE